MTVVRRDRWRAVRTAARYVVLLVVLIFCLFPIFWVIATSVKMPAEFLRNPPVWIPQNPTLAHYGNVMAQRGNLALKNSVIIACGATVLSMFVGSLAAYSLARLNTGGRHFAFWLLSQRLMPPVVLVVPFFLLLRELGQINPALGLDSHAGLIATGTFAFIFSWMEFLFAVVFTRTKAVTLPVAIAGFSGSQGSNWGQASALAVVAMVPVFALALLVQRHFVRGLTLGAVRG